MRPDRLLVLLFVAALIAPWIDLAVRPDEARSPQPREHRVPAAEPEWSLDATELCKFPEAYESYFKDSFGLRDVLLRWHSLQSLELFGASPTEKVLLGRQGWYFYTGDQSVEIYRGLLPFTEPQLHAWKVGLELRRDWLRGLGADYLFVIAPNKETVYPDFMPELEKVGPTRLEQFAEYLRRNSDVDFLDLRPAFAAAREQDAPQSHLYLEEGTHWNARGALAAYQAILSHLAPRWPALAPLPDSSWKRVPFETTGDSWASNMYIGDLSREREVGLMCEPSHARPRRFSSGHNDPFGPGRMVVLGTEDPGQPRALMFHDSFGPFIENLLAEHFSQLECIWTYDLDAAALLAFRPQLVIDLWVERTFDFRDPNQLGPRETESAQDEFVRSQQTCLALDPRASPPQAEPTGRLEVRETSDADGPALLLQTRSAADSLLLPPLACEPKGRPLVHLTIDSPEDGVFDILYLQPEDHEYSRQRNGYAILERGRNDLYLRLPEARVTGRLRLRPAYSTRGPYLLRAFEVRSSVPP